MTKINSSICSIKQIKQRGSFQDNQLKQTFPLMTSREVILRNSLSVWLSQLCHTDAAVCVPSGHLPRCRWRSIRLWPPFTFSAGLCVFLILCASHIKNPGNLVISMYKEISQDEAEWICFSSLHVASWSILGLQWLAQTWHATLDPLFG